MRMKEPEEKKDPGQEKKEIKDRDFLTHRKQAKCRSCLYNIECYGTRYCQRIFKPVKY